MSSLLVHKSIFVVFIIQPFLVNADQICAPLDENDVMIECPADTCCNQSNCTTEASKYKCCDKPPGFRCSNCPTCINCIWGPWGACGKFEEECGDGLSPKRIRGEMTRKPVTQLNPVTGEQVVTGPGGVCPGEIIEGKERKTKAPCFEDCPEHCILSEWSYTSSWSNTDNDPPCGFRTKERKVTQEPDYGGTTCEKKYSCQTLSECLNGKDERDCHDSCTVNGNPGDGESRGSCGEGLICFPDGSCRKHDPFPWWAYVLIALCLAAVIVLVLYLIPSTREKILKKAEKLRNLRG